MIDTIDNRDNSKQQEIIALGLLYCALDATAVTFRVIHIITLSTRHVIYVTSVSHGHVVKASASSF